jgi:hypothetical protein
MAGGPGTLPAPSGPEVVAGTVRPAASVGGDEERGALLAVDGVAGPVAVPVGMLDAPAAPWPSVPLHAARADMVSTSRTAARPCREGTVIDQPPLDEKCW